MAFLTTEGQVDILVKEIDLLKNKNKELVNQMIAIVEATQKGFQILNEDITRIAKLK